MDARPGPIIAECAKHADLFICEGMYAEKEKEAKARQYKHMTFYEAADLAKSGSDRNVVDTLQSVSDQSRELYG